MTIGPLHKSSTAPVAEVVNTAEVFAMSQDARGSRSLTANTLIMYGRTVLVMAVSLYSSRVVLAHLGAVDFGIYFAVAAVTLVIAFLNSALAVSTQRYLTVGLTHQNKDQLRSVFSMSLQMHAGIGLLIFLSAQTFGIWFLHHHMVIPPERMQAATWALQCATMSVVFTVLQVPYNALLTATERFSAHAAFDVAYAILRLFAAFALLIDAGDRLELFSSLMFGVTFVIWLVKAGYCFWAFDVSRYRLCGDLRILRQLASFAGWSLVEGLSVVLNVQGIGLLLNVYFGPVANASLGIANQVSVASATLASNLQVTASPRIMKSLFSQNIQEFQATLERNAKAACFLMLVLVVPVALETETLLSIWLGTVPEFTADMVRLLLLVGVVNSLSSSLVSAIQATGHIRKYQLTVGGLMLTSMPVSMLLLWNGAGPLSAHWFLLILSCLAVGLRVHLVRQAIGVDARRFVRNVVLPAVLVTGVSFLGGKAAGLMVEALGLPALCSPAAIFVVTSASVFLLGLSGDERVWLRDIVKTRFKPLLGVPT